MLYEVITNFVNISCNDLDNSPNNIPLNTVNISFGDFYVTKELQVNIK